MELFCPENARTWVVGKRKVNIEPLMGLGCCEAYAKPQTSTEHIIHKWQGYDRVGQAIQETWN